MEISTESTESLARLLSAADALELLQRGPTFWEITWERMLGVPEVQTDVCSGKVPGLKVEL